ncbi:hypothetical protein PRUB_a0383 [Pseudoalteromonas rubra]|uniref:Uncharacterized protein n=1 Tax=Pseudoalteromonas rubra TaxID=43658 RepID=A0A8T0C7D3_9GAMM|nr:hypothetical protein PRUB_a0383 [Pseudoalteromonas rubra]
MELYRASLWQYFQGPIAFYILKAYKIGKRTLHEFRSNDEAFAVFKHCLLVVTVYGSLGKSKPECFPSYV